MFDFFSDPELTAIVILYILVSIVIILIAIAFLRFILPRGMHKADAFRMAVLRITIPKEGQNDDQTHKQMTAEQIKQRISVAESIFATLGGMSPQKAFWLGRSDHFSLEIVTEHDGLISFYAAVPRTLRQYFEQQIHAQYEMAEIVEMEDYNIFGPQSAIVGTSLHLANHQMYSILTYDKMESDPMNALTNVLSKIEKTEGAAIQFVLRPAHGNWRTMPVKVARTVQQGKSINQAMNEVKANIIVKAWNEIWKTINSSANKKNQGIDPQTNREYRLSPMETEVVKMLEQKASKSGFEVNIRIVVSAQNKEIAEFKLNNIVSVFAQYAEYQYGNTFVAAHGKDHTKVIHDFIYRAFHERKSFVLNTKEMATLWHLPLPSTETPNIRWLGARKAPPPANMPKEGVVLGKVDYRGVETLVRMKRADRRRHAYIIGKSGSGKSVLMTSMAIQDIQNGEGVAVIDPHGDLIEDILPHIPPERADDVIIFNPSDIERPVGLNMMEYESPEQRDFAVQEMIAIFYKMFGEEMIGPMFEHYMRNAMLALMEDQEAGATLLEIPRLFTDEKFRKQKIAKVQNMIVRNFWEGEYEQSQQGQQAADMLSYLISKIGRFLTNDMMRNIIGQAKSSFNIREVMDHQKILLVNLSKGTVGEVNSSLLGFIMVSKIQMAAMARADMAKEKRKDFYLYVDEFQNFTTDSISTILSEARKYMLDLTLAHQYVAQLVKNNDTRIRDAIFGNVGTMAAFRVGADDVEVLAKEFAPVFDQHDILNVEQYTANIKLLIDNTASRPFNMKTLLPPHGNNAIVPHLKELSRQKYGRPRLEVEEEIRDRAQWDTLNKQNSFLGPESFI
ncbi:MAG: type IV secretion system DNA-binding domain-containing protein [Candidatus Kerfeldbacteria bacterium]|nr:type IV secretion system DNA-binding domain-containing protein [Candidatus Kerfeldbacteria bacterium]